MSLKRIAIILLGLCAFCCTWAQSIESQVTSLPTARPKIMVIPYTMQGEDIRTVLVVTGGCRYQFFKTQLLSL